MGFKEYLLGLQNDSPWTKLWPDVYSLDQIIVFKNGILLHKFQLYRQLDDLVTLGPDPYMAAHR